MITILENKEGTYRLIYAPIDNAKIRVSELTNADGAWIEKDSIVVSQDRALCLRDFAIRNHFHQPTS